MRIRRARWSRWIRPSGTFSTARRLTQMQRMLPVTRSCCSLTRCMGMRASMSMATSRERSIVAWGKRSFALQRMGDSGSICWSRTRDASISQQRSVESARELWGTFGSTGGVLRDWEIVPLPLDQPPTDSYSEQACAGPCFYRGAFQVSAPGDSYLNTSSLGKGVVWVNGHLLGRFWNIGPMGSLFLPGAWLHSGKNQVTVMDLDGGPTASLSADDHPTYLVPKTAPKSGETP
jgi:hypothetical protein